MGLSYFELRAEKRKTSSSDKFHDFIDSDRGAVLGLDIWAKIEIDEPTLSDDPKPIN